LNSIKNFFSNDDLFNFNYGQTLVQLENFAEAEPVLEGITSSEFTNELAYQLALARACKPTFKILN
jgi:intraflagellar transport protein 56